MPLRAQCAGHRLADLSNAPDTRHHWRLNNVKYHSTKVRKEQDPQHLKLRRTKKCLTLLNCFVEEVRRCKTCRTSKDLQPERRGDSRPSNCNQHGHFEGSLTAPRPWHSGAKADRSDNISQAYARQLKHVKSVGHCGSMLGHIVFGLAVRVQQGAFTSQLVPCCNCQVKSVR